MTKRISISICGDCALAIRMTIEEQEGVEAVAVNGAGIAVAFDETRISGREIEMLARASLVKHGHPVAG